MNTLVIRSAAAALVLGSLCGCFRRDSYWYPEVRAISPSDGDVGVALDATVEAEFDRRMRPVTFTSDTFYVEQGTTRVPGTIAFFDDDRTVVFTPAADLDPDTLYTVVIRREVEDRYDRRLRRDVIWDFTTTSASTATLDEDLIRRELLLASFRAHAAAAGFAPDELTDDPGDPSLDDRGLARALCGQLTDDEALADRIADAFLTEWQGSIGRSPDPASRTVTGLRQAR